MASKTFRQQQLKRLKRSFEQLGRVMELDPSARDPLAVAELSVLAQAACSLYPSLLGRWLVPSSPTGGENLVDVIQRVQATVESLKVSGESEGNVEKLYQILLAGAKAFPDFITLFTKALHEGLCYRAGHCPLCQERALECQFYCDECGKDIKDIQL